MVFVFSVRMVGSLCVRSHSPQKTWLVASAWCAYRTLLACYGLVSLDNLCALHASVWIALNRQVLINAVTGEVAHST